MDETITSEQDAPTIKEGAAATTSADGRRYAVYCVSMGGQPQLVRKTSTYFDVYKTAGEKGVAPLAAKMAKAASSRGTALTVYVFDLRLGRAGRTSSLVAAASTTWLLARPKQSGRLLEYGDEESVHTSWGGERVKGVRDLSCNESFQERYLLLDTAAAEAARSEIGWLHEELCKICREYGVGIVRPNTYPVEVEEELNAAGEAFRKACVLLMTVLPSKALLDLEHLSNPANEFNCAVRDGRLDSTPQSDYEQLLREANALSTLWRGNKTVSLGELAWAVMAVEKSFPDILPLLAGYYDQLAGKSSAQPSYEEDPDAF